METYEEKYKDLVKRLNKAREEKGVYIFNSVLDAVAPELKECEDEMICGKLIAFLKQCKAVYGDGFKQFGLDIYDAIAWIEKQGEHKKFRGSIQVGDKVTRNEDGVLVNLSQLKRVAKKYEKQGEQKPTDTVEPRFKINDIVIHKETGKIWTIHYYLKDTNSYYVEDNDGLLHHYRESELKLVEQKPTEWSEQDKENLYHVDALIKDLSLEVRRQEYLSNWLKSLRPQSQWKPSDEQINTLWDAIVYVEGYNSNFKGSGSVLEKLYNDLKKLKD